MNYRHAFHAGNFADVLKHAVLCRILLHLRDKPAAFRVIDTHAGAGRYDLGGPEAGTQPANGARASSGSSRRRSASRARRLLAPYLDAIAAFNNPGSSDLLSRFARARARVSARAGSADRLRA